MSGNLNSNYIEKDDFNLKTEDINYKDLKNSILEKYSQFSVIKNKKFNYCRRIYRCNFGCKCISSTSQSCKKNLYVQYI